MASEHSSSRPALHEMICIDQFQDSCQILLLQHIVPPSRSDGILLQEELHEFKRLGSLGNFSSSEKHLSSLFKWIYKVKIDELGGILKIRLDWSLVVSQEGVSIRRVIRSSGCKIRGYSNFSSVLLLTLNMVSIKWSEDCVSDAQCVVMYVVFIPDIQRLLQRLSGSYYEHVEIEIGNELLLKSDDGLKYLFLGLRFSKSQKGAFNNQSKYALNPLKNLVYESCDLVDTPMVEKSKLDEDKEGKV
ncbi:hypothetical protein Tco_0493804 [Tanacetum coccineum]